MADEKVTQLSAVTTLDDTDLFTVVVDVGGTPTNKKITAANVATELGGGLGAPLFIESADEVAQRNGTTGQSFYVYKSFTDVNNWSRLKIAVSSSNDFQVTFQAMSAGVPANPPGHLQFRWGASRYVGFDGSVLYPDANNTIDLGSGSLRWGALRAVNVWAQTQFLLEGGTGLVDGGNANGGVAKFQSWSAGSDGTWSGGEFSPSLGSSNLDNYALASNAHFQRWSSGAAIDVTGMTRTQVQGQTHLIVNVGSNNITLKHDVTSTAANRFLNSTGADIVLAPNQAADVIYDATTQRWRVFKRN